MELFLYGGKNLSVRYWQKVSKCETVPLFAPDCLDRRFINSTKNPLNSRLIKVWKSEKLKVWKIISLPPCQGGLHFSNFDWEWIQGIYCWMLWRHPVHRVGLSHVLACFAEVSRLIIILVGIEFNVAFHFITFHYMIVKKIHIHLRGGIVL